MFWTKKKYTYWVFYSVSTGDGQSGVSASAVTLNTPISTSADVFALTEKLQKETGHKNIVISHWTKLNNT